MNDVLEESAVGAGVGAGVETEAGSGDETTSGVEACAASVLEAEDDEVSGTDAETGDDVSVESSSTVASLALDDAVEEIDELVGVEDPATVAPSSLEVEFVPLEMESSDEVAGADAPVDTAGVVEADVATLDVEASPICHTSVSPTFVICPDVAKEGGKNPPQYISVPVVYVAEFAAEKEGFGSPMVWGRPSAFATSCQFPRQVVGEKSWTSALVDNWRMPKNETTIIATKPTAHAHGCRMRNFGFKLRTLRP